MSSTHIIPSEDALYERVRLGIFAADLPVQRLESDVPAIKRFTAPDVRSSHRRLTQMMPPLTPAAEAIIRATIRTYGAGLFRSGMANLVLRTLIQAGPIRFAHQALLIGKNSSMAEYAPELLRKFGRIFERHPESGYALARDLLFRAGLPVGRTDLQVATQNSNRERVIQMVSDTECPPPAVVPQI